MLKKVYREEQTGMEPCQKHYGRTDDGEACVGSRYRRILEADTTDDVYYKIYYTL